MEANNLLDTKQAAEYLNLHPQTLHNLRCRGEGPDYTRLGKTRGIRYYFDALEKWVSERVVKSGVA